MFRVFVVAFLYSMISNIFTLRYRSYPLCKKFLSASNVLLRYSSQNSDDSSNYVALSFYRFAPMSDAAADSVVSVANRYLSDMKGTLLVSTEGINGQFAILENQVPELKAILEKVATEVDVPKLKDIDFNLGETFRYQSDIDEEKDTGSEIVRTEFPFKKLIVKRKKQILTDGIEEPLNWSDSGPELSAEDWHRQLEGMQNNTDHSGPILLDCRNKYESDIGTFSGAVPLNTSTFSETWSALEAALQDVHPDRPVLTFCTGGIRCVKVNAYLRQKLGYRNVGRLEKGIIGYQQWLDGDVGVPSMFQGENFLFDRRRLEDGGLNNKSQ